MSLWVPRASPAVLARSTGRVTRLAAATAVLPRYSPLSATRSLAHPNYIQLTCLSTVPADPQSSQPAKPTPPVQKEVSSKPKPPAPLMTRVWSKVKHEANHYWSGTKLLVSEVRISSRLQWKILHGESLTRRERRQVRVFLARVLGKRS
jgi:LETM1 and EF-hand domain-containing protein 1, mitochondrial